MPGPKKKLSLALQGGGAHGAFTWGVLDGILLDGRIEIDAVSGTSAGAMNAAVLAQGLATGGNDGAREALRAFWKAVARAGQWSPIRRTPLEIMLGRWSVDLSPGLAIFDMVQRFASPHEFNPFDINPLRDLVLETIDFEAIRNCHDIKLFISATNVETGKVRVFGNAELTADVVMASACLPFLFKAVEINGTPYWDGGYMGNPSLFPFNDKSTCGDVLIIQINPVNRKGAPTSARDIMNRVNEITFNSSLLKELRAIDFVARLLDEGALDPDRYRKLRVHIAEDTEHLADMGASSKLNTEWEFLEELHDHGLHAAQSWLEKHFDDIGSASSVNLRVMFEGIGAYPHHG